MKATRHTTKQALTKLDHTDLAAPSAHLATEIGIHICVCFLALGSSQAAPSLLFRGPQLQSKESQVKIVEVNETNKADNSSSVTFTCDVSGFPTPQIRWFERNTNRVRHFTFIKSELAYFYSWTSLMTSQRALTVSLLLGIYKTDNRNMFVFGKRLFIHIN